MSCSSQDVQSALCDKTQGCSPLRLHPNLVRRMVVANALFLRGTTRKSLPKNIPEGLFLHHALLQKEKRGLLNRKNWRLRTKTLFLNPRYDREAVLPKSQSPYPAGLEGPLGKQGFLSNQETFTERENIPWTLRKASGKPGTGRK